MKAPFFALVGLLFAMNLPQSSLAGARDARWKAVDDAVKKGLPQTAITNLEPIIAAAMKEKAYAEATKAIGQKIALEGVVQGNKPEEKITRLEAEIAKAPKEMVPLMDTLLAEWYWHYFQQNRWRFMQRTATAQAPGKDFTTWDLARLFAEIDKQFQKALAAEKTLKTTPISAWDALLQKGTMPDSWRPTLFDFIAQEALEFYTSGEQAAAKPEDAFELAADGPIFDGTDQFVAWKPETTDTESPKLKAIRLYQELMRFHQSDPTPWLAFAAVDLERLTWGWNTAFGEEKNARYKAALEPFIRVNSDFEISALAMEREARVLQVEGDLVAAHKLAQRGAEIFPNSPGGKLCKNLVTEIEAKSARITTERVWNCSGTGFQPVSPTTNRAQDGRATDRQDACPTITVRYRNVDAVYFRAIPVAWDTFLEKRRNRPENLTDKERREILAKTPALEWSAKLPPTTDYKEKSFAVAAPTTLKPGFYFIAASHDPKFGETANLVSMTDVFVSDLALVTRTFEGKLEGFVLDANSGEPVSGAEVDVWHLDNQGTRVADPKLTTDADGFFSMKPTQDRGYLFRIRHDGRELATAGDVYSHRWQNRAQPRPEVQTIFFTDRAIYRPGQTIYYKGIRLRVDQAKDNYEVVAGAGITIVFLDANGKEIARAQHKSNDYGSFQGAFTAPRDRLMGRMRIGVLNETSATDFNVEEYKRPKFEVTLDTPKTAPKLNEKVSLAGHATSYTGAAVDGAAVKYRVTRQVRWPWWWGGRGGELQEIAHGTALTETDGSFKIEFTAKADPKVLEKDEPTFVFEVMVDVTDNAGETNPYHDTFRVGYSALEATLGADEWQTDVKPVELKVTTQTLDGEPQVAEGSVKIHELQAPASVQRPALTGGDFDGDGQPDKDLSDPNNWPLGKVVAERGFTTDTNGNATLSFKLPAGAFRVVLETQDRFGKKVTGRRPLTVLQPDSPKLAIKVPHLFEAPKWEAQPGEEFMALWGTGYDTGRAFVEIEQRQKMIQRFWTQPGRTQQQIKLAVTEALRGGFTLHVTQVRENRAYLESRRVSVPWSNKDLDLRWEHFVSKLQPGQKETWTLEVRSAKSEVRSLEKSVAELVATLYDESLDAFAPLAWPHGFSIFREDYSTLQSQFANLSRDFYRVFGRWDRPMAGVAITYRHFPPDLTQNVWGYGYAVRFARMRGAMPAEAGFLGGAPTPMALNDMAVASPAPAGMTPLTAAKPEAVAQGVKAFFAEATGAGGARAKTDLLDLVPLPKQVDLSKVTARKNLNETAFFFPQLTSDSNGVVRMTFSMPEALTKWHFLGFAHDKQIRSGWLESHAVTSKDLMVQPNAPRFLREGDTIEFTVKVSNQSDQRQSGQVKLSFTDAATLQPMDNVLGVQPVQSGTGFQPVSPGAKQGQAGSLSHSEQSFSIPAKESRTYAWRISVPDGAPFLNFKAVAATDKFSDGEEGAVPVLSRRVFVTESLPLWIRGPGSKQFTFKKLADSGKSKTLRSEDLVVQMVSNPAWYAVMALPYLMEFPYECSEQTFNRFYANTLARSIANSDPKIRRIFDLWKNTPALESPLMKNQDLKAVMLEETPWLRQAQNESEARKNVGILFDENRLNTETEATLRKLTEMQLEDGRWPWFPGGYANDYITLYIVTGFGRLRHLQVDVDVAPAVRALQRLDAWMTEHYERIQKREKPEEYVPGPTDALYLYGRSFFLKDMPVAAPHQPAVEFFLKQSRKFWLQTDSRQTQGHLAIALKRWGGADNLAIARGIIESLKQRSVTDAELGRFWRDTELSWWWYRAPIETQALMIEAFDEVAGDPAVVEDCRVWLLNQKRTQDWKTTKATADAVYALLLRGRDLLASTELVQVKLGGVDVTPGRKSEARNPKSAVEPGTGFYERHFSGAEVKPNMGEITVTKVDTGSAWGGVHWQYFEDISKITPHEGTPLKLTKSLFTKVNTAKGPVLEPVKGALAVCDELVVRIVLRTDRDMEYVHLKDQRGSGTEPVNVLSRYKYQDGLGYYESTRDVASHFFIDYLPKGTYVFEYSTRVQLRGQYQTGIAEIQCMYAPEFNSHSESIPLVVE